MKFVENVKNAWKWLSVQMMILAFAFQSAWELAPQEIKAGLTPTHAYYITVALLVIGVLGRLVKQTPDVPK